MSSNGSKMRMVKSVVLTGYGGYEKLEVKPWPLPAEPAEGQVEVTVHTCGMNFADLYTRQGLMRDRSPPFVLGMECAGEVSAVGTGVTSFKVGDRVLCYQYKGDLYREIVVVPVSNVFLLPEYVTYEQGAAMAANYLTAYFCVFDIGNLRPGQNIFIESCAGGVGCAATQLARTIPDVTIYGTCSAIKSQAALFNGVTHVLDRDLYESQLCQDGTKLDIIIDSVGGTHFTRNQNLLNPLGRIILIGSSGIITNEKKIGLWNLLRVWWETNNVKPIDLIVNNRIVAGLHLGLLLEQTPQRVQAALQHLFSLLQSNKIKPIIDSTWNLDQVIVATETLGERRNIGKVLLRVLHSKSNKRTDLNTPDLCNEQQVS